MGRATRWLKGLLGMKKDKGQEDNSTARDRKEKKRWSFSKPGRDPSGVGQIPLNFPANIQVDSAWLRSYISETENEQNKHAIAVAAATAAAADAAVAAAKAAVAVVRLTSHGRGGREKWAATKIQTVFRGYLVSGSSFSIHFLTSEASNSSLKSILSLGLFSVPPVPAAFSLVFSHWRLYF